MRTYLNLFKPLYDLPRGNTYLDFICKII